MAHVRLFLMALNDTTSTVSMRMNARQRQTINDLDYLMARSPLLYTIVYQLGSQAPQEVEDDERGADSRLAALARDTVNAIAGNLNNVWHENSAAYDAEVQRFLEAHPGVRIIRQGEATGPHYEGAVALNPGFDFSTPNRAGHEAGRQRHELPSGLSFKHYTPNSTPHDNREPKGTKFNNKLSKRQGDRIQGTVSREPAKVGAKNESLMKIEFTLIRRNNVGSKLREDWLFTYGHPVDWNNRDSIRRLNAWREQILRRLFGNKRSTRKYWTLWEKNRLIYLIKAQMAEDPSRKKLQWNRIHNDFNRGHAGQVSRVGSRLAAENDKKGNAQNAADASSTATTLQEPRGNPMRTLASIHGQVNRWPEVKALVPGGEKRNASSKGDDAFAIVLDHEFKEEGVIDPDDDSLLDDGGEGSPEIDQGDDSIIDVGYDEEDEEDEDAMDMDESSFGAPGHNDYAEDSEEEAAQVAAFTSAEQIEEDMEQ